MLPVVINMRTQSRIVVFHGKAVCLHDRLFIAIRAACPNEREKEEHAQQNAAQIPSFHRIIFPEKLKSRRHQKLQLADREIVRGIPGAMELPEAYQ